MHDSDFSFWDFIVPRGINHFLLPLYDHFRHRPYHIRTVRRELNLTQMRDDMAGELLRSEVRCDPEQQNDKREDVRRLLFRFAEDVFCYVEDDELTVYAPTGKQALELAERLATKYAKAKPVEQPGFYLLNADRASVDAECIKITHPVVLSEIELALHYGSEIVEFEQELIASLREQTGGTSVFRGGPGTGKTSFVRHLIAKLQVTHRFYYLPTSADRYLACPEMVEFWRRQTRATRNLKKVVILEDAEELLMQRSVDNRNKVSTLLNIADGLLGEFLQMHLICTVNCPLEKLDPAIVRRGRLVACREFKRLDYCQAHRLADTKGITLPEQSDYSLAEIYRPPVIGESPITKMGLGFAA